MRITSSTAWLRVTAAALVGLVLVSAVPAVQAATNVTLTGRVHNTSGVGYGNIEIKVCTGGTLKSVRTNANGNWSLAVPNGSTYCVRLGANAPVGTPMTRNNPGYAGSSYEKQVAGYAKGGQDRAVDGGLDFVYGQAPAAPKPAASAPAAKPAATPVPTPVGVLGTPTDFVAKQGANNAKAVELSWQPGGDAAAVTAYRLERSLDSTAWQEIATVNQTSHKDEAVSPNVRYFYRLVALGAPGQESPPLVTNVEVGAVLGVGESSQADIIITSEDRRVTVTIRAGVVPKDASCTLASQQDVAAGDRFVITDAYDLQCRAPSGDAVAAMSETITWRFDVKEGMKGHVDPVVVDFANNAQGELVSGVAYDKQAGTITVEASAVGRYAVLASKPSNAWMNYIAVGIGIIALLSLVALIPLRTARKQNYQEYLRSKYYNL